MTPWETYEHAGLTVELHYDETGINPRKDSDNAGVIISFTREFDGDECPCASDDGLTRACPRCEGSGSDPERWELLRTKPYGSEVVGAGTHASMEAEWDRAGEGYSIDPADCLQCKGDGVLDCNIPEYVADINGPGALVLPLRFSDYGASGAQLYVFEPDDANAAIYCTAEVIEKEWEGDREKAQKCLEAEVDEVGHWLKNEVYGYIIKGPEGRELPEPFAMDNSCWGFIGEDKYVREEADRAAESIAESLAEEAQEAAEMAARDIVTVER